MPVENGAISSGERIIRIDERTKRMAKDIEDIKISLDEKVDKAECVEHRSIEQRETDSVKRIALSKRSKAECSDKHKALDDRVGEQKDDWKFWVTAVALIIFGLFDVFMAIRMGAL